MSDIIERGCLVSLSVRLFDAQGNLLEESSAPLMYLHGADDIFPRIEQALEGQRVGFSTSVRLEPHDAFGDYDVNLVHLVDVAKLGQGTAVGMRFEGLPGVPSDGRIYTVTDIADKVAVLDGNHELAGRALRFDLRVVGIERVTEEQLSEAQRPRTPDFLRPVQSQDLHSDDDGHVH
jgi:FKBP-type peptidyl-prolyl cis-trans isomerase SlyD